jgi:uncharacterized protein YfbU (UPF0304 family)
MVENWFEQYLLMARLDQLDKNSFQYREMKRVFYAGVGTFLIELKETIESSENEEKMINFIESLSLNIAQFYETESIERDIGGSNG